MPTSIPFFTQSRPASLHSSLSSIRQLRFVQCVFTPNFLCLKTYSVRESCAHRSQKGVGRPLERELQMVVSARQVQNWVWSSLRAAWCSNYWVTEPLLQLDSFCNSLSISGAYETDQTSPRKEFCFCWNYKPGQPLWGSCSSGLYPKSVQLTHSRHLCVVLTDAPLQHPRAPAHVPISRWMVKHIHKKIGMARKSQTQEDLSGPGAASLPKSKETNKTAGCNIRKQRALGTALGILLWTSHKSTQNWAHTRMHTHTHIPHTCIPHMCTYTHIPHMCTYTLH